MDDTSPALPWYSRSRTLGSSRQSSPLNGIAALSHLLVRTASELTHSAQQQHQTFLPLQAEGHFSSFFGPIAAQLGRSLQEPTQRAPSFPEVSKPSAARPALPQSLTNGLTTPLTLQPHHCCRAGRSQPHEQRSQQRPLLRSQRQLRQSAHAGDSDHYQ